MTASPAVTTPMVLDATCLSHFARADRIDVLRDLLTDCQCWTTETVLEELDRGIVDYPLLAKVSAREWLHIARLDSVPEIRLYEKWLLRVSSQGRDEGEASVFAIAERHERTAITDDQTATRVARSYGLEVHGTIWLLARACGTGRLTESGAGSLVDALRGTGHRLPCTGAEFPAFARRYKLL